MSTIERISVILLYINKITYTFTYLLMRKDPRFGWTGVGKLMAIEALSLEELRDGICSALAVDGRTLVDEPSVFREIRGVDWTRFCREHFDVTIAKDGLGAFEIPCPHQRDSEGNSIAHKDNTIILTPPIDPNALFEAICKSAKIGPLHKKKLLQKLAG